MIGDIRGSLQKKESRNSCHWTVDELSDGYESSSDEGVEDHVASVHPDVEDGGDSIRVDADGNPLSLALGGCWSHNPESVESAGGHATTYVGGKGGQMNPLYLDEMRTGQTTQMDIDRAMELDEAPWTPTKKSFQSRSELKACELADKLHTSFTSEFRRSRRLVTNLLKDLGRPFTDYDAEGEIQDETRSLIGLSRTAMHQPFRDPAKRYQELSLMTAEERAEEATKFDEIVASSRDWLIWYEGEAVQEYRDHMFGERSRSSLDRSSHSSSPEL